MRCRMEKKTYNKPLGYTALEHRESTIRKEWTDRVNKKMERIKGEGYAERQIQDTLSRVEKIRTEL